MFVIIFVLQCETHPMHGDSLLRTAMLCVVTFNVKKLNYYKSESAPSLSNLVGLNKKKVGMDECVENYDG